LTIHCVAAASAYSECWIVGRATFTTEPSMNAMLDPMMVAANVSRLRLGGRAASKAGDAWITAASQGGRENPIIGYSRRTVIVG
jgi:hypothetical protein